MQIFAEAEYDDARHLDHDEHDNGERERHVEIGIDRTEERAELIAVIETYRADAGRKLEHIGSEYEEEQCDEEREEKSRKLSAFERFRDVVVDEFDHPLEEGLYARRQKFRSSSDEDAERHE